jgi:hypothetical protein
VKPALIDLLLWTITQRRHIISQIIARINKERQPMAKRYETPRLIATSLQMGVFGDYGGQDGSGSGGGGCGWGWGWGRGWGWGWWH